MNLPENEECRPARNETACEPQDQFTLSLPNPSRPLLAVVVRRQLATGGTRTTIYRTLAPAERALDRAAKAGLTAVVEFVRLVPVQAPSADELAALDEGVAG